jgi:site-specific DNA-methyltransferase (adenine-specific)
LSVVFQPDCRFHEYLFLLSRSGRYYYDADAIREPNGCGDYRARSRLWTEGRAKNQQRGYGYHGSGDAKPFSKPPPLGANKRSVWTVPIQPYAEAHYAPCPEGLVRPCLLAGCPFGGRVLNPFAGSGTPLAVAKSLGCEAVGIELNPAYIRLAHKRLARQQRALLSPKPEARGPVREARLPGF